MADDPTDDPSTEPEAIEHAASGPGSVLITGSFHTVGDAMSLLPLATKPG